MLLFHSSKYFGENLYAIVAFYTFFMFYVALFPYEYSNVVHVSQCFYNIYTFYFHIFRLEKSLL